MQYVHYHIHNDLNALHFEIHTLMLPDVQSTVT